METHQKLRSAQTDRKEDGLAADICSSLKDASHPHALKARKGPQGPQSSQSAQRLDGPQLRVSQDVGCQRHQRHLKDTECPGVTRVTHSHRPPGPPQPCSYVNNEEVEPAPGIAEVQLESVGEPLENHLQNEHVGEHLVRVL